MYVVISKFSWGSMPPDPPTRLCMFYIPSLILRLLSDVLQATNVRRLGNEAIARAQKTASAMRTAPIPTLYVCPPLSSISGSALGTAYGFHGSCGWL